MNGPDWPSPRRWAGLGCFGLDGVIARPAGVRITVDDDAVTRKGRSIGSGLNRVALFVNSKDAH